MLITIIHFEGDFRSCYRLECIVQKYVKFFNEILLKDIQLICSLELDQQFECII